MTEKKINKQEEKVESQKLKKQGEIEFSDEQLDAVGGGLGVDICRWGNPKHNKVHRP